MPEPIYGLSRGVPCAWAYLRLGQAPGVGPGMGPGQPWPGAGSGTLLWGSHLGRADGQIVSDAGEGQGGEVGREVGGLQPHDLARSHRTPPNGETLAHSHRTPLNGETWSAHTTPTKGRVLAYSHHAHQKGDLARSHHTRDDPARSHHTRQQAVIHHQTHHKAVIHTTPTKMSPGPFTPHPPTGGHSPEAGTHPLALGGGGGVRGRGGWMKLMARNAWDEINGTKLMG